MEDQSILNVQEQTKNLLLSIIYHQQLDMDSMTDDAVWYVGSFQVHLTKKEIPGYLEENAIDVPSDTPQMKFNESDYMGRECISVDGELKYHSMHGHEKLVRVFTHAIWVLTGGRWMVKKLITSSQRAANDSKEIFGDMRLDYKTLIRHLPFAVICCTLETNLPVQRISEQALDLLDYNSIQDYRHHLGNTIMSAVHPEDIPAFNRYVEDLRAGKQPEQIPIRMRKKDFTYVSIQMYGTFVKEGWMVFAYVDHSENQKTIDKITEEMKALEAQQERIRRVIAHSPAGFYTCSLSNPIHMDFVSDSLCEMTGYSREERMQLSYAEMVTPEDGKAIADTVRSLMLYPHVEQVIYRMKRKDGSVIRVMDKMRSVRRADGSMWGYSIVINLDDQNPSQQTQRSVPEAPAAAPAAVSAQGPAQAAAADMKTGHRVEIKTFGYFEVWVDGSPIAFRSAKARELLALLVDRRGNFISREAIVDALWENETTNSTTLARCRKTYMNLVTELKNYGVEDIVETENGMRRIIPEKVNCDLFNYQRGDETAVQQFKGLYMSEYSWAEITLAGLLNRE